MRHSLQANEFLKLKDDVQLFCGDSTAYLYRSGNKSLKINLSNQKTEDYLKSLFRELKQGATFHILIRRAKKNLSGIDAKDLIFVLKKNNFFMNMDDRELINQNDLERYERQLNWFDINLPQKSAYKIQNKIFGQKICLFGLGSLGNLLLMELAAMGFRNFSIIDKNVVEASNLNRQILYTKENIGQPKVLVARRWLKSFDRNIKIEAIRKNIDLYDNLRKTISRCDLLILTADEPKSDIVIWTSRHCALTKIPWVRFSRMGIGPLCANKTDACAACVLPVVTKSKKLNKFLNETDFSLNRRKSVIISEVSFAISIMVHEVLLYLTRSSLDRLQNVILTTAVDGKNYKLKKQTVRKNTNCPCNIYAKWPPNK